MSPEIEKPSVIPLATLVSAMEGIGTGIRYANDQHQVPADWIEASIAEFAGPLWQSMDPEHQQALFDLVVAINRGINKADLPRVWWDDLPENE